MRLARRHIWLPWLGLKATFQVTERLHGAEESTCSLWSHHLATVPPGEAPTSPWSPRALLLAFCLHPAPLSWTDSLAFRARVSYLFIMKPFPSPWPALETLWAITPDPFYPAWPVSASKLSPPQAEHLRSLCELGPDFPQGPLFLA